MGEAKRRREAGETPRFQSKGLSVLQEIHRRQQMALAKLNTLDAQVPHSERSFVRHHINPQINPKPHQRVGGDFIRYLQYELQTNVTTYGRIIASVSKGEKPEEVNPTVNVPCNGCTLCCTIPIYRNVAEARPEDLPYQQWVANKDGREFLAKRPDGYCVHLTEAGCGIYDHRPGVCRSYDCRKWGLVGVKLSYTEGRTCLPDWQFSISSFLGCFLYSLMRIVFNKAAAIAMLMVEDESEVATAMYEYVLMGLPDLIDSYEMHMSVWRQVNKEKGYPDHTMYGVVVEVFTEEFKRYHGLKLVNVDVIQSMVERSHNIMRV